MVVNRGIDSSRAPVGFLPLYRQVKHVLVDRIARGVWKAGDALPSEFELAADLSTSQGTVRKALDEMTSENLLVRRQGRGTYVARHDDARIMFQFFRLVPDRGEANFPDSRVLSVGIGAADAETAARLEVPRRSRVVRLVRARSLGGAVMILERIALAAEPFAPLARGEVPNNLYELYATRFGVTVARARERLKAVAATDEEARVLGVSPGSPLLMIDRVATAIEGRTVEWRRSWCRTNNAHYISDLR